MTLSTGSSTTTNGNGFYQFANVTAGSYGVTAAKVAYTSSTANGVVVTAGSTTTQDFALVAAPTGGTLQGTVTDVATAQALSGATVALSGGASTSTNASGAYQFTNLAAGSYTATASKTGYHPSSANSVLVTAGTTTTQNFALTAPPPTITGFTPNRGRVGSTVTITGTNLTTTHSIVFNTHPATTFTVKSATQITATVPSGATTGRIKVTTSGGTATSSQVFRVR